MRVTCGGRPFVLLALLCGALSTYGGTAAARTIATIGGTVSPAITGFPTSPRSVGLSVDARFSTDVAGQSPATIRRATIYFSHGARVNGGLFPGCSATRLQRAHGSARACPRGSRLGAGSAVGTALGVSETLSVKVYNGPGGRSILFHLHGDNPVAIDGLIDAPLRSIHSRLYGYRLTMPVPENLQVLGPGILASLTRFTVTVKASTRVHGRTRGYIELLACPPGALVPVRGAFDFRNEASTSANGYLGCR